MAKPDHASKGNQPDAGSTNGNGLGKLAKEFAQADDLYFVDFTALNGSGITGGALLAVNDQNTPDNLLDDTLTVFIAAQGLEPNQVHIQHIHGFRGEDAPEAVTPPPSADTDGDGFIELAEGLPFYGEILLNLSSPQGAGLEGFPTAPDGTIFFSQTYHLHPDSADTGHGGHASGDVIEDFANLDEYEIVLHGLSVGTEGAGTDGEVNGIAEYKLVLPVASGVIESFDDGNGASALAQLRNAFDGHGQDSSWFL